MKKPNLNADIVNNNTFQSLKYKTELLGNAVAYEIDSILRNTTVGVTLSYMIKFYGSLEIPYSNCNVELKHKWMNHCALTALGSDN